MPGQRGPRPQAEGKALSTDEIRPEARIGTVIGERFELISLLAEGGMGWVFLAEDLKLDRMRVALKVLKREVASDAEVLARFEREAKTMLALSHEHIVAPLGFGQSPEGEICLVMELVQGETLRTLLERTPRIPPWGVVEISRQLGEALTRAHDLGVVHRDLKPENVMISWLPDGKPWLKVLDFGMARILGDAAGTPLTRKGAIFGTPEYMSPEQSMGQPVDARSDQYAFGVMIFEMIAGERPFKAKSALAMVQAQIRQPPPPLAEVVPGLSAAVVAVVERMLAKRADDRYPDVQSAAAALAQAFALK